MSGGETKGKLASALEWRDGIEMTERERRSLTISRCLRRAVAPWV
jgi:hypothetical protein